MVQKGPQTAWNLKKDYKSWTLETSFDANITAQMEVDSGIVVSLYSLGDSEVSLYKSDFVMMRKNGQKGPAQGLEFEKGLHILDFGD
jgi:hypothetical protein